MTSQNNSDLRPLTTLNSCTRPTLHSLQPISTSTSNSNSQEQPLSASSLSAPEHNYSNPSSSVSRASSARSTSSVQAVPFRIPTRLTTTTTTTNTTNTSANNSNSPSNIDQLMINSIDNQLIQPLQNLAIHQPPSSISTITTSSTIEQQKNLTRPSLPRNHSTSSTNNQARKGIKDFIVGDILGEGSYSTVYHVKDKQAPNKEYALKVLDKRHIQKEKKTKYVAIERDTLNLLDHHPGCIRLYSTFQDECSLYYLLEFAPKGEILRSIKTLGSFSTDCARFYAAQILSAIEHMHSRGVIHRDIKPENILLDSEMRIKIADFGSAKILHPSSSTSTVTTAGNEPGSERSHSFVGTAEYVSPELLVQKVTSKSSDLWAFGCVLFQMITGVPPFRSRSEYLTFQKITHLEYEFPVGFPSDGQDLVSRLLVLEPEMRIGASMERGGFGEIKTHAFFDSIDWDRLWELLPPLLQPGLVVAAPPPENLDQQHPPEPVYLPEFYQQDLLPPPPPLLPSPDPPFQPPEPHPPCTGLGLALPDSHDHLLTHPVDSDDDLVHQPESKASLGHALSKRKSWLLGAGRRKSKEDHFVYSSSGEMTWAEVYLPNELVLYSSVVNELWGISGSSSSYSHNTTTSSGKPATASKMVESLRGKKKKKRQLILTDFPRLLCVKEDGKSSKVRVKFEVLFKPLPSPITTTVTITSPVESRNGEEEGGVAHQRLAEGHCKTPSAASSSSHLTYSSSASHSTATRSHPQQPELASPRAPSVEPLHPPPHQHHLLPNQLLLFKKVEIENPRCFKIETVLSLFFFSLRL